MICSNCSSDHLKQKSMRAPLTVSDGYNGLRRKDAGPFEVPDIQKVITNDWIVKDLNHWGHMIYVFHDYH